MRIAIVSRWELFYNTELHLYGLGHPIVRILTSKEAPEYIRTAADFRAVAVTWQIPFAQGGHIAGDADFCEPRRPISQPASITHA